MVASYEQGYDAQAKQSTRFLARGASVTSLTTDLSQRLTDVTAGTSSVYETSSSRFNHGSPRTIGVRVEMSSANTGTLWRRNTAGNTERLSFSAANTIRIVVANATVTELAVTAPTGTDECVIAWVTEANPDTTGAGDAYRSRIMHWNVTDGTFTATPWVAHVAITTASATTAVYGADDSAGASAFAGTMTAAWFENRVQTGAEIAADWVQTRIVVSSDLEIVRQGFPPQADTLDARNQWHGPAMMWVADATRRMIRRTFSPVWNECMTTQPAWSDALLVDSPAIRGAPGASDWRIHRAWRRVVPVPVTASHVWVRVHVRTYVTSGAAVPLGIRAYSWNRIPGVPSEEGGPPEPLVQYWTPTVTISRDDTSTGLGSYSTLGLLPISRGRSGVMDNKTAIAIAFNIDPAAASANDAAERFVLRAVHVVPVWYEPTNGLQIGGLAP